MKRFAFASRTMRYLAIATLASLLFPALALGDDATPVASPEPATYDVIEFAVAEVPPPIEPLVGSQLIALTQVTLAPGTEVPRSTGHQGPSILYVLSGMICYDLFMSTNATVTLYAPSAAGESPEGIAVDGCAPPPAECASSCELEAGAKVLLQAGDVVVQVVAPDRVVSRGYANASAEPAVVLLAQFRVETRAAPCGGGCP